MRFILPIFFCTLSLALAKQQLRYSNDNQAKVSADTAVSERCSVDRDSARFDCFPDANANEDACVKRGCCWKAPQKNDVGVPYCYFPSDFPSYKAVNQTTNGSVTTVALFNPATSIFRPNIIQNLVAEYITYENGIQRIRVYDPSNKRYEVPIPLFNGNAPKLASKRLLNFAPNGFTLHSSDGRLLLASSPNAPLIFTDQFIQITGILPGGAYAYGLGESVSPLRKNLTSWQRYTFYARDQAPSAGTNLYGVHPFTMIVREDGIACGLFFLNSNAMETDLTPYPAITFRTIGGIIDIFMFEGPTPIDVIHQYHSVISKPAMPPYWSLGFHLCRYGYGNDVELMNVINRTLTGAFPYDAQWVDIDHMDSYLDWTVDKVRFGNLSKIIGYLHSIGMRFVNIIDPAISNQQLPGKYAPYDQGHEMNLFIKNAGGEELVGKVWPGLTVFPDFTHPNASTYFAMQAAEFKKTVDFDGLWLDMNEPSNFVEGSTQGCTNNSLDNPPYVPALAGSKLQASTICPSARHHISEHYNLHSLFGYFESKTAYEALLRVTPNKRPFLLSRSTFVGSGQWASHWTGDISSRWTDMHYSISQILNFNMFGIPMVGADVCGFAGVTQEDLCVRWMQLGSFYPFFRNHNNLGKRAQDPGVFSPASQAAIRLAMFSRYELLPYLYTLMYRAHVNGSMVVNPLFLAFHNDSQTYGIDDQFLWGHAYMISPVLQAGVSSRSVYFPNATWYVAAGGSKVNARAKRIDVAAPLSVLPMHIRGGTVIPSQSPAFTTEASRRNPYYLIVALDEYTNMAFGELFIDDGVSLDSIASGQYSLIKFSANSTTMVSSAEHNGYSPSQHYSTSLQQITVLGLKKLPTIVTVNNIPSVYQYLANQILIVKTFVDILQPIVINWS